MNAILLARYADRMADNLSKITGKPYTAEDYMRERLHIVADAQNTDAQGYGQPITNLDLDLDAQVNVLDLDVMDNLPKGKNPNAVLEYIKKAISGKQIPTGDFKAIVGIPTDANWVEKDGQRHIVFNKSIQNKDSRFARNKVLVNFDRIISATQLVEISENKKIAHAKGRSAQRRKNMVKNYYRMFVPVNMNGQLYTLLITAEDFNGNVEVVPQKVSLYEIAAKKIKANRELATQSVPPQMASTLSIREVLQGVKDVDGNPYINSDGSGNFAVYNQPAYHGSPHEFDKFDLGAIGSGEGAQAHGWGLYFAQDRKVSERYREKLARKNRNKGVILYDGKEDAEVSNAMRYYGSAGLYSALSKESRDEVKAQKEISNTLVGMQNDIERWDKQVKFYQKHIDRIKENPKLSITAFLKEAPKEDVSKLKDIVDDARSFARMRGQRTNIKGVLDRLQAKKEMPLNEKDFLTRYANILENLDVDKLEVDIPTGSLLEVDIPENDVLLDEDKPLSEQPEKVQKAIRECGKRVAMGKYVDYNGKTYKSVKGSLFSGWIDESDNKRVRRGSELEKELNKMESSIYEKEYTYNIFKKDDTGVDVYSKLVKELGSPKEASQKLNEHGIKGITYDGYRDGRCYVVFDDKAISIIERYNQSVRGQTKIGGMSRVVSLFESADKSTFVHELGHVALADLKMLAEMDDAPQQLVRDWQTVKEWIGYKDSQGFTREQHEKFARGFEAYLRTGKAPVRGLKAVFRTFKKWLCDIYADFMQLGGKPSPEIQAVILPSKFFLKVTFDKLSLSKVTGEFLRNIPSQTSLHKHSKFIYSSLIIIDGEL